jgi:hypothetical protein
VSPAASWADEADSVDTQIPLEATFHWRNAFLPPGIPTVAIRADETAALWNPAGLAFSPVYYLGYAWKGTYQESDLTVSTHFFLTKAAGFGIGYVRDNYSGDSKNMYLLSIAPQVTNFFAVGFTGKWKGGFNFDLGAMVRLGPRISMGFVGRDIRTRDVRRHYWESGIAMMIARGLIIHSDVIVEDGDLRIETAWGGGFQVNLESGLSFGGTVFTDGEGHTIIRGGLRLKMPTKVVEGDYSTSNDDFQTLGFRFSSLSQ